MEQSPASIHTAASSVIFWYSYFSTSVEQGLFGANECSSYEMKALGFISSYGIVWYKYNLMIFSTPFMPLSEASSLGLHSNLDMKIRLFVFSA